MIRIPIEIHLCERGLQTICMDPDRLPDLLGLSDQDIERLRDSGLVHDMPPVLQPKKIIDYAALQQTYARMLADGPFANQTELLRQLGVSRAWVSRVLKGIKRKVR